MDEQLRKLQLIELEMLKQLITICERYKLRYCVLAGTLLGSVRHKGFIPWDDDIDVGMPRADYERLLSVIERELPIHLKAMHAFSSPPSMYYFTQIRDMRTKVKVESANITEEKNVWIDVFPIDGVPGRLLQRLWYSFRVLYLRMRIQFTLFDQIVHQHRLHRPLHERFLIMICKFTKLGQRTSTISRMKKFDHFLKKYDFDSHDMAINAMSAYKLKEIFPKGIFEHLAAYQFEDIQVLGPAEYDTYLRQLYGDYMKPPSADTAALHHKIRIIEL